MNAIFKKISTLIPAALIMFAVVGATAVTSLTQFIGNAQSSPIEVSFTADKAEAKIGEDIQYTLMVKNTSAEDVTNVRAAVTLSDKVTYMAGSSKAEKGSNTVDFADSWIQDTANLGTLTSAQQVFLRFTAKTNSDVTVGHVMTTTIQVKSDKTEWEPKSAAVTVKAVDGKAALQGGNFVKIANITKGGGWQDEEISADPRNVTEFLIQVRNTSEVPAYNVTVKANLPSKSNLTAPLLPSITVDSSNADSISDSVKVNVANPSYMILYPGHAKIGGSTDLFNCPNECDFPESLYHTPVNMGTIEPGELIQVKFKADVFSPTSSPTPTPTPSPSPTPEPGKDRSCFEARVFEDLNKNGKYDEGEPGLTWEIDWRRNSDQTWTEYKTYEDKKGMGGRICVDDEPDITTRLRVKDWCVPTTPTEQNGKLELKKTKYFEFGCTRGKPTVKKGQPPKQLPKTGSAGEILLGLSGSLTAIGTGLTIVRRRLTN